MFYINFYNQNSSFALSNAERKLRYHTKLNEERHEEVKQQNWERKREKKNTVLTEEQKEERRIKERERKRLYREKQVLKASIICL